MQPTLLILAAGMASRYGSMKQIQGFGPSGETIMEYSIYDAIRAGFKKVVFIIREEFADDFRNIFEPKLKGKIETGYVFQDLKSFAVINADDFYGKDAFKKAYEFLTKECSEKVYSIIGYDLVKTLSDNGTVNRGVCQVDSKGNLSSIAERVNNSDPNGQIGVEDGFEC